MDIFKMASAVLSMLALVTEASAAGEEADVVLLIGGWTNDYIDVRSVEVFGQPGCSPNLTLPDDTRLNPTSHYIDGHIFVCGGIGSLGVPHNCLQLVDGVFKVHSQLKEARGYHSGVVLNGTLFIMGGWDVYDINDPIYGKNSMETLNGTTWTLSKNKLEHGTDIDRSCVVALDNTQAMVIGGLGKKDDAVSIYDAERGWTTIESLPGKSRVFLEYNYTAPGTRFGHSCVVLGNGQVLVAGGTRGGTKLYTAVIYNGDSWEKLPGRLNTARSFGQMVKLNGRILYFGGNGGIDVNFKRLDSVEEFDEDTGTWKLLQQTMEIPRSDFTAVVVPASAVGCHL